MNHWFSNTLLILLLTIIVSILTTGCSTTLEIAEDHFEKGRLNEALATVEKARELDPHDPNITTLENRIRSQWLADHLIQVRLLRLGGNHDASGKLLREVLARQSAWVMMPTGAVFATQSEEVQLLAGRILYEVRSALNNGRPLLALHLLQRDRALLQDTLKIEPANLRQQVRKQISDMCLRDGKNLGREDHYHTIFLNQTCSLSNALPTNSKFLTRPTRNSVRLFQKIEARFEVKNLSPISKQEISDELGHIFESSIWFDKSPPANLPSAVLFLEIRGLLSDVLSSRTAYRSQPFTVQVPYETRTVRARQERTGLTLLFEVLAWALTTYQPDREIDNGDGTVTVYETAYRSETRYHTYQVEEFTQTLTADWNIRVATPSSRNLASSSRPPTEPRIGLGPEFRFYESYRLVSDEHSTSFAQARIEPEKRKVLTSEEWLKTVNRKLMDQITAQLNTAWVQKFCFFKSEQLLLTKTELHHRCIYGANGNSPAETANWFVERYGIEIETWRRLVGMPDSK